MIAEAMKAARKKVATRVGKTKDRIPVPKGATQMDLITVVTEVLLVIGVDL